MTDEEIKAYIVEKAIRPSELGEDLLKLEREILQQLEHLEVRIKRES